MLYCNSKNPVLSSKTVGWLYHITYFTRAGERYDGCRGGFSVKQVAAERGSGAVFFVYAAQILTGGKEKNELTFRENKVNSSAPGGWPRYAAPGGSGFCVVSTTIFCRILLVSLAAKWKSDIYIMDSIKARKIALLGASV